MSVKYRIQFTSGKYAIPYRLDIYDAAYSGTPVELAGANPPVVLRKDSDGIFSGTSLDIGIEVPASMPWGITDLYSQSARDHKVELYKSNTLIWSGYLVPEEYSDPLIAPPFDIFLRAVDGIGTLKDFDFAMTANTHQSHLAIIQHCLANLSLSLPLAVLMNIREDAHDAAWNALSQTYINTSAFYDEDGDPLTCDEVISLILQSYDPDITLTQHAGYWMITRDIDAAANAYTTYNVDGAQLASSVAITSTINLDSLSAYNADKCFPLGYLTRTMHPQAKKKTLEIDYHLNANILPCKNTAADFSYDATAGWVSKYFLYMESAGNYDLLSCRRIITNDGNYACHAVTSWGGIHSIWTSLGFQYVMPQSDVSFNLLLSVASMHPSRTENTTIAVEVRINVSDTLTYFLSETGWSTTEASIKLSVATQKVNTSEAALTELSIIAPPVPASGHLQLSITPTIYFESGNYTSPFGFILGETSLRYIREDGENPFESSLTADILINSNALKSETLQCYGDAPAAESVAADIWFSAFLKADKLPTSKWRMSGDTTSVGLLTVLARSIASNNRKARQQYSGTLMGAGLSPNSIIAHAGNEGRTFNIVTASHNLIADELEVELRELLPYAEAQLQLATSPVYGDAKQSLTSTDGSNNYTVFGGNVGIGKRIPQLPLATSLEGKYIILDKEGNESAEKYPYVEGLSKAIFDNMFELRTDASNNEYICAKFPFASVGAIVARSTNVNIPSMWDGLPLATATTKGGIVIGTSLVIDPATGVVNVASGVGSQTLSIEGTILSISNGNSVTIPAGYSDAQARAACAASGTVYDSARLGGLLPGKYVDSVEYDFVAAGLGDFNTIIGSSKVTSAYAALNTPFGESWYNLINVRHRGGDADGNIYGGQLAWVMALGNANNIAFRSQFNDTWGSWNTIPTVNNSQTVSASWRFDGGLYVNDTNIRSFVDAINSMFELVPNNGNPYIKAKYGFASVGAITARVAGAVDSTLWDSLPAATTAKYGGIKLGTASDTGLTMVNGVLKVDGSVLSPSLTFTETTLTVGSQSVSLSSIAPTWDNISGKPSTFTPSAHDHSYESLTSKPTILGGFDVTYAIPKQTIDNTHQDAVEWNGFYRSNAAYLSQYINLRNPDNPGYGFQIGNAYDDALRFRNKYDGTWGAYRTIWHDGNFNPTNYSLIGHVHSTSIITEGANLYFTDARARAACAASGTVYDSARLGGVAASSYTRRDVTENISYRWAFESGLLAGTTTKGTLINYDAVNNWGTINPLHGGYDWTSLQLCQNNGNVGIGLTNQPSYKLHVNGDILGNWHRAVKDHGLYIQDAGVYYTNNGNIAEISSGDNQLTISSISSTIYINYSQGRIRTVPNKFIWCAGAGTTTYAEMEFGNMLVNGNILATGAVTARTASDANLKHNVRTITNAMALFHKLRPVEFDYNETAMSLNPEWRKNPHSASFIAQEWEQVLPWATGSIFEKYKGIDNHVLHAYTAAALVQLDKKIESEVELLRREVSELKMELKQLKRA